MAKSTRITKITELNELCLVVEVEVDEETGRKRGEVGTWRFRVTVKRPTTYELTGRATTRPMSRPSGVAVYDCCRRRARDIAHRVARDRWGA